VTDIAIFVVGGGEDPEVPSELGCHAAIAALRCFRDRTAARLAASRRPIAPGVLEAAIGRFEVTSEPQGRAVSFDTFLGSGYDFRRDALGESEYADYWRSARGVDEDGDDGGFVRALLDPPYSLSLTADSAPRPQYANKHELVREVLGTFFGGRDGKLAGPLKITRWDSDWSNYFDQGNDWWGSYFWTVEKVWDEEIVVIGASATD